MNQKHFASALVILLLPLSFGVGKAATTPSESTSGAADPIHFQINGLKGFAAVDIAGRRPSFNIDFADDSGMPIKTFVSSYDAAVTRRDMSCERPSNLRNTVEDSGLNIDCISAGGAHGTMGFPMYDAFSASEHAQYSRTVGSLGIVGPGLGGGGTTGTGTGTTPIVTTPIATPEPGTILLLVIGLLGLVTMSRGRARRVTK